MAAVIALATAMLVLTPHSASAASCGQHSQAWTGAFGYGILHSDLPSSQTLTVPAGTPIFHTGIVVPGTRIRFQYINLDANATFFISSGTASSNCVVPHQQAVLDTSIFGGTRWGVGALYVAWEDNQLRSVVLGTLIVT